MKNMVYKLWLKNFFIVFIVSVIGIGNVVYELGNLIGVVIGLDVFISIGIGFWVSILGMIVIVLFWLGSYKWIEIVLVYFVFIMVGVFFIMLLVVKFDIVVMFS